jgi:membrane-bound lytic murein transglycosylase B
MKRLHSILLAFATLTTACGVSANPPLETSTPPLARSNLSTLTPVPADFQAWRASFRPRAIEAGIAPQVFDAAFAGVAPNPDVVRLDSRQAEFVKPIWEYLDGAASADRIGTGRARLAELDRTLAAIEATYGVQRQVVLAVWGMESNFGRIRGDIPVVESLATLAWQGRRRGFAEEQLVAALRILQSGDVSPAAMKGSWAGAMGHTQFIPTSYLAYAVDFTGDGRRDVWGDDPTDALASAANYLARFGWQRGRPWGVEVRVPAGFNFAEADQGNRRPVEHWRARGVVTAAGGILPDHGAAAILAPAGAQGPVFAVYNNFYVIKRYNNATSYAMGVGHLGDRIAGAGPFVAAWPRGERALSRSESQELQSRLTALGFDTGSTDGVIGPNTTAAIRAYQSARGLTPDGFASATLLQSLR